MKISTAICLGALALVGAGCARTDRAPTTAEGSRYGCQVHRDVALPQPGLCPVCGEPLRPVDSRPANSLAERAPELDGPRDH